MLSKGNINVCSEIPARHPAKNYNRNTDHMMLELHIIGSFFPLKIHFDNIKIFYKILLKLCKKINNVKKNYKNLDYYEGYDSIRL